MTIRLEEIVYLHCHQQGKGRAGGVITPHSLEYIFGECLYGGVLHRLQDRCAELWVVTAV